MAIVAADYVFNDILLRDPAETKYAGVRLELPWDKMGTFLAVGLPLFLISLSFAQEVSVGSRISCFTPKDFSPKQAAYMDSFCWAAVQLQNLPLWLHKFFPYILLLMAILVYIPALIWRFTAAPHLSSDLKFIMVELDRCYNRAIKLAKKQISSGSTDNPKTTVRVLEMSRGCLKDILVEHYLKSKCSSCSLLVKYLICQVLTLVFLLLAYTFLGYYIYSVYWAFRSDEFSCDLRTGLLQNDSVVPSAVQCKLVAVGVFGLLSIINLVMYAFFAPIVVYAVLRLKCQSSSFLQPYEILLRTRTLSVFKPCCNDLSIYLLFLEENLSHVESFKRLQALKKFLSLEASPQSSSLGQGDSASRRIQNEVVLPVSGTSSTYCGPSSDTGSTGRGQPLTGGLTPPGEPPRGLPEGHSRMPSPNPQNTGLAGQSAPEDPAEGVELVPVQDENQHTR